MQVISNDYKLPAMPEVTCFTERSREESFLSPDMEDLVPGDQLAVNPGLAMRDSAAIGVVCRDAAGGSKASLIAPIFSVSGVQTPIDTEYNYRHVKKGKKGEG